MTARLLGLIAITCACLGPVVAQLENPSPEIDDSGMVTFRLDAPNADSVVLMGRPPLRKQAMERGSDGLWSVTLGPLAPDIYNYYFDVDGLRVLDPKNRFTKKWLRMESAFQVLDQESPFAIRDGPFGQVHRHTYRSASRDGAATAYLVYTPPNYDPRGDQRYPVVFLLHGYGDDETAWHEFGRANVIADNLINAGRATPAIVVMPHGHPEPLPFGQPNQPDYGRVNHARMETQVRDEILPQIDRNYLTLPGRANRAIVGLSMGGGHALGIGSSNLDTFAWIGGFSSGGPSSNYETVFAGFKNTVADPTTTPRLLWIACGEDDFLIERNRQFVTWLESEGIAHQWFETNGNHSWPIWRDYWERFFPLLFRGTGSATNQ